MGSATKAQEESAAIKKELDQLTAAAEKYLKLSSSGDASETDVAPYKYELMMKTMRLLQTIRGPVDMVFANFEDVSGERPPTAFVQTWVETISCKGPSADSPRCQE